MTLIPPLSGWESDAPILCSDKTKPECCFHYLVGCERSCGRNSSARFCFEVATILPGSQSSDSDPARPQPPHFDTLSSCRIASSTIPVTWSTRTVLICPRFLPVYPLIVPITEVSALNTSDFSASNMEAIKHHFRHHSRTSCSSASQTVSAIPTATHRETQDRQCC